MRALRTVAAVSGIYDAVIGVAMLLGRPLLSQLFAVPPPEPPIHADLNGVFLLSVAAGYLIPYRDPESAGGRAYLWVMGPLLKGGGAATFLLDHLLRGSPRSFLLFAASDGTLAAITLWALLAQRSVARARSSRPSALSPDARSSGSSGASTSKPEYLPR